MPRKKSIQAPDSEQLELPGAEPALLGAEAKASKTQSAEKSAKAKKASS